MGEAELGGGSDDLCRAGGTRWLVVFLRLPRYILLVPWSASPAGGQSPKDGEAACRASTSGSRLSPGP